MQPEADDTCWQGRAGRDPNNVGKGCQWQLQSCKDHAVSEVVVGWQRLCPVTWQVMFMHVRLKFAPFPVCNPRLHVRHVRTREEGKLGSHDMGASDSETFFNMWLCELQAGGQKKQLMQLHDDAALVETIIASKLSSGHFRPHPDAPDDPNATMYFVTRLYSKPRGYVLSWLAPQEA